MEEQHPPLPPSSVNEATRERETFRYDEFLLASSRINDEASAIPSEELRSCADGTLTALAQLATCQTGTARSLISLFDHQRQYIITEATPTLPLAPSIDPTRHGETLWLCGTAIPRYHGVCEYTLRAGDPSDFDCRDADASPDAELPIIVVDDLTTDPRFMWKPYCQPGSPARFYAAAPLRTARGINIGVICVIHTAPITHWTETHSDIMRNLARITMGHLEASRLKSVQRRNERMMKGLSMFLEGKSASPMWPNGGVSPFLSIYPASKETEGDGVQQQRQQHSEPSSEPPAYSTPESMVDGPRTTPDKAITEPPYPATEPESRRDPERLFSEAACLIKESLDVDGCLFLEANPEDSNGVLPMQQSHGAETATAAAAAAETYYTTSSDDEGDFESENSGVRHPWPRSQVLGRSVERTGIKTPESEDCVVDDVSFSPSNAFPQSFLQRLLRKYPKGHVFHFCNNGMLQRSDSQDTQLSQAAENEQSMPKKRQPRTWDRQRTGRLMLKAFPGARSVAFAPIWNPRKEAWSIGAFAYTKAPTRVFGHDTDINYLRAFGMLAAIEKLRLETQIADKAKADALGSLSHELRSPLHGILLGVELLHETTLSVSQGNLAHVLETCCRTLTDTVDHLLDYSKINHFMNKETAQRRGSAPRGLRGDAASPMEAGLQTLRRDTQLDVLVEEVMESVYAGFNFQHLSIAQLSRRGSATGAHTDTSAMRRLDSVQAMEELEPALNKQGEAQVQFGEVTIVFTVDPSRSWAFATQPGAIRRIVMNLFGNALKYTKRGTIKVALECEDVAGEGDEDDTWVTFSVSDTGVGMGQKFQHNGLYKAFSQENALAPGTGLGLSLVKQIVTGLRGKICVESELGVGTTVRVELPLRRCANPGRQAKPAMTTGHTNGTVRHKLSGLRVNVMGFKGKIRDDASGDVSEGTPKPSARGLMEQLCKKQLHMDINVDEATTPDVIVASQDVHSALVAGQDGRQETPTVVVCPNALSVHDHRSGDKNAEDAGLWEYISQPVTPTKLENAIWRVLEHKNAKESKLRSMTVNTELTEVIMSPPVIEVTLKPPHLLTPTELMQQTQDYFAAPELLLVDDNAINLKILASYANKLGRPYSTATNGLEAVEAFQKNMGSYRCVLMDISMPVMDGFEATRRIRALELRNKLTPTLVLALSGLASAGAQREAIGSGVDIFLSKPVRLKELSAILTSRGVLDA